MYLIKNSKTDSKSSEKLLEIRKSAREVVGSFKWKGVKGALMDKPIVEEINDIFASCLSAEDTGESSEEMDDFEENIWELKGQWGKLCACTPPWLDSIHPSVLKDNKQEIMLNSRLRCVN